MVTFHNNPGKLITLSLSGDDLDLGLRKLVEKLFHPCKCGQKTNPPMQPATLSLPSIREFPLRLTTSHVVTQTPKHIASVALPHNFTARLCARARDDFAPN